VPEKSIGYVRLVEACDGPGCPVCAYLDADSRRQLTTLFEEHVTDVATRRKLRASHGLCNWHTWMALEVRPAVTGVAIVYEDLLRVCHERVRAAGDRRRGRFARLRAWLGATSGGSRRANRTQRDRCAVCVHLRTAEAHCLEAVLRFADDPEFERAYERSGGLCAPHLLAVAGRGAATPGVEMIVEQTLAKWQALRADLGRFVAKHEYRNTAPITDDEARAYQRAFETLAGGRNVFGNDLHPGVT
jgi:hypothetical protein